MLALRRSRASRDACTHLFSTLEGIQSLTRDRAALTDGPTVSTVPTVCTHVWLKGQSLRSLPSARPSAPSSWFSSSTYTPRSINLDAPPVSLEYHGAARVVSTAPADASVFKKLLLFMGGYYSKQSAYMRAAKELNACVKEQATDPSVCTALDIPLDSFQHQHAMLCLHVWMVLKRLRLEGKPGKKISQVMYDEFQDDVEHMVRQAGVQVRLGKHLSELEKQFYGSCTAYDRAMGGDPPETLADAVWRNVYQADEARRGASERLARYVKRGVACLAKTPSSVILEGRISFQ